MIRDVFVGIDVAFAKSKRLPISVCVMQGTELKPILLRTGFDKPPAGAGNRLALQLDVRQAFADAVGHWLQKLENDMRLKIQRIAIDAPSDYCTHGLTRRLCEQALDSSGISCFATPTKDQFEAKIRVSHSHLMAGGKEANMPNANQIWMLVGFELFSRLSHAGFTCIETYPQAIVRALNAHSSHKSTEDGFTGQLKRAALATGYSSSSALQSDLDLMGFGSRHDKLDAFLSAWVASLPPDQEKVFGSRPNDAIVVPNIAKIEMTSVQQEESN